MDTSGIIININEAFHLRFGYEKNDLAGKNFSILFIEEDREANKPERELENTLSLGSANDENYLVHKDGNKIWVTGESVYIENTKDEAFVVKIVHNIHAQKQLERFLLESHEFIDTVFDSVDESALLMLDSRLRVIKANRAFVEMFELGKPVAEGNRLSEIDNSFWQRPDIKQETVNFLTMHNVSEKKIFPIETKQGKKRQISFRAKLVEGTPGVERKLLVMLKFVS
jgi:PAS domain S-box-containing protein